MRSTYLTLLALAVTSPTLAQLPADLALQVVPNLTVTSPTGITHAGDGSNRIFIVEQDGRILVYDLTTESLLGTFLNISASVDDAGDEQGLLGLAFDPDFANNRFFYVNYTYDPGAGLDRTRISRFTVPMGTPDDADEGSESILLELEQDASNHNGGWIGFGPDGYLWIATGDGGGSGDPNNRAQTLWYTDAGLRDQALLGKFLRIQPGGTITGGEEGCGLVQNYGIPDDNPFTGSSNSCDEIFVYGMRNPWRASFGRWGGDLLIGDVGQFNWEEFDVLEAGSPGGENFGWDCREGAHPYTDVNSGSVCSGALVEPKIEYNQTTAGRCAITGGYRYAGYTIGGLQDRYIYGDYCSGEIWTAVEAPAGTWTATAWTDLTGGFAALTTFGEDEAGTVYLGLRNTSSLGASIRRFVSPDSIFGDTFESGGLAGWSSQVP